MSIVDFLRSNNVPVREGGSHRHVRIGWIGIDCPRCGPGSGKFHAGIREDLTGAACWRCGCLSIVDVLVESTGLGWSEIRKVLESSGSVLASPRNRPEVAGRVECPAGLKSLYGPFKRYLRDRGFDPDALGLLWDLRAMGPEAGRMAWRIWIPIHLAGRIVSWTSRTIGASGPRYISAPPESEERSHKTLLYGEDLAANSIVVVEGPADVWAIGPGAVSVMGLQTTPEQIERIARHPVRTICFDGEHNAQRRADKLADVLIQYPGDTYVLRLETGKDPADADPEEIEDVKRRFLSEGLEDSGSGL